MLIEGYSCGVPIFANKHVAKCKQCDKDVELGINPRIVSSENISRQGDPMLPVRNTELR